VSFVRGSGRLPGTSTQDGRAVVLHEEKRRAIRSSSLGVGTLACRHCDAPVAIADQRLSLTDTLSCPFCAWTGPVRDFLSLARPVRPARVVVRVTQPAP
jgi:hypothetical protein